MTILAAIRKPSFVLMAAERLFCDYIWSGTRLEPVAMGQHEKITLHKTLPLGCCTAGIASFDGQDKRTIIKEVLDRISAPYQFDIDYITRSMARRFRPLVATELSKGSLPPDQNRDKLEIVTAVCKAGRTRLAMLRIAKKSCDFVESKGFFSKPLELAEYYSTAPYKDESWFYGDHLDDPSELGQHLRQLIAAGIEYESSLWPDRQNRLCGGPIDVAIVDAAGARCLGPQSL